jgi:hypothetical protein
VKQEKSTLAKSRDFYQAETGDRRQTGNEEQDEEERRTAFRFDRRTTKTGTQAKLGEISPTNRCKGKQKPNKNKPTNQFITSDEIHMKLKTTHGMQQRDLHRPYILHQKKRNRESSEDFLNLLSAIWKNGKKLERRSCGHHHELHLHIELTAVTRKWGETRHKPHQNVGKNQEK